MPEFSRRRYVIPGVAAVAVMLLIGAFTMSANAASDRSPKPAAGGDTLTFTHLDYDGGYTGTFDLTALGNLSNWTLSFDLPAGTTITDFWRANLAVSGQHFTFTPNQFTNNLTPGEMIGIGFLGVTGDGETPGLPQNCTFDGAPCGGAFGGGPTGVGVTPTTPPAPSSTTSPSKAPTHHRRKHHR
jgi:chitinase